MKKEIVQYYSLRLFLLCLFVTAGMFLYMIWLIGDPDDSMEVYAKTVATFFIVGLASFLVWFTAVLLQVKTLLENSSYG